MRRLLLFALLAGLWPVLAWSQTPVVSPSAPVIKQGTTTTFLCTSNCGTGGTWALTGTDASGNPTSGAGSINTATGQYTAPASVTPTHSRGGFPIKSPNHIYNTDIFGMPVHASSNAWITAANIGGTTNWQLDFPLNLLNYPPSCTTTDTMSFYYTPENNGTFTVPCFPTAKAEAGWFGARQYFTTNTDHHVMMVDVSNGQFSEFYQYYTAVPTTAASVSGNVATLTVPLDDTKNMFYTGNPVCIGSFPGADAFFNKCPATITGQTSTTISYALVHADATATSNGKVTGNFGSRACSIAGTCNSQSGIKYAHGSYALPPASTDAAGAELQPLILDIQEFEQAMATGTNITHAFRNTFAIGALTNNGSFLWPAMLGVNDGGVVPFGACFRLKSSFVISGYSAAAQILLRALQHYCTFPMDGGNNWPMNAEQTRWPKLYYDALAEIAATAKTFTVTNTSITGNVATVVANNDFTGGISRAAITGTANCGGSVNVSNVIVTTATGTQFTFALSHADCAGGADTGSAKSNLANYYEVADISGAKIAAGNLTCPVPANCGLTKFNREIITYTSSTGSTSVDVALEGVAVNLPENQLYIMAGTPAQTLTAFVNIGAVTWTMSPSVGTLTSGGVYTAPATIGTKTDIIVTATSAVNSAVAAQMTVTIFPSTGIYALPSKTTNYTDSIGNTWFARTGVSFPDTQACCACDNSSHFQALTDITLFNCQVGDASIIGGDALFDFLVPNGSYQFTYNYGTATLPGTKKVKFAIGTNQIYPNIDLPTLAGGQYKPLSIPSIVQVSNNHLTASIYRMNNAGNPVSSLSVVLVPPTSAINVYLAQAAAGAANGSSCANARAASYFNSAANWGIGTTLIGAGTTVHLCGTISTSLSAPTSSNGLVTVVWETAARLNQPVAATYISTGSWTNDWIFDGGFPCGQLTTGNIACNGFVGNTANGTNLANQVSPSWGFDINKTNGTILIKNLDIGNIYVHAPPVALVSGTSNGTNKVTFTCSGTCGFTAGQAGLSLGQTTNGGYNDLNDDLRVFSTSGSTLVLIYPATVAAGSSTGGIVSDDTSNDAFCCGQNAVRADFLQKNLTIQDCNIHDAGWAIYQNVRTAVGARIEIARNNIYNMNHAFAMGTVIGAPSYSVSFHDNWVHDFYPWDNVSNRYHHDGIHIFSNQLDDSAMWIYNNKFGGGTKDLYENVTGYLFLQGTPQNVTIYNNFLQCTSATCKNPFLLKQAGGLNQRILYNTFTSTGVAPSSTDPFLNVPAVANTLSGGAGHTSGNNLFKGNIVDGGSPLMDSESVIYAAGGLNYNLYSNCIVGGNKCFIWNGPIRTTSFATWQALSAEGVNSLFVSSAGLDANGRLLAVSPATGAGVNLTSLCAENADMAALCKGSTFGNTIVPVSRSVGGAWDIGADAFSAGLPAAPIAQLSPLFFDFGIQAVTTTSAAQTFTLSNNGTATLTMSAALTDVNAADFSISGGTCGASIAASASCTYTVTFTPSATGIRTATLRVTDNAAGSPHTVALSGTGGPAPFPVATLLPGVLIFQGIAVNTLSVPGGIALQNTGTATLNISSIVLGGLNPSDFSTLNNCGPTLAPQAFCLIGVTFTPQQLGMRLASVVITDDASDSPQSLFLIGNPAANIIGNVKFSGVVTITANP